MAAHQPPALVSWVYVPEDEPIARDLLRLARVLEKQGLVRNASVAWMDLPLPPAMLASGSPVAPPPGAPRTPASPWPKGHGFGIREGVAVFLVSPAALVDEYWGYLLGNALLNRRLRTLLVLVRPIALHDLPAEARQLVTLPKDGEPIAMRRDSEDALLDVIQVIQEVAELRRAAMPSIPHHGRAHHVLSINDIFRLSGPPTVTFVEPPRFRELQLELGTMGAGLIVEGPSKTGKSTAIRKAMDALDIPAQEQLWWAGQSPLPLDEFQRTLDELRRSDHRRWLFIDDFHYLEDQRYLRALAFTMKALADQSRSNAKVTLIGINPLGASLVQAMPDLAGRFRIMRVDREHDWERSTLISAR